MSQQTSLAWSGPPVPARDPAELKHAVSRALARRGLLPDPASYRAVLAEVLHWGAEERDRLAATLGRRTWRHFLYQLRLREAEREAIRVLGIGRALTEYCGAFNHLTPSVRSQVVSLGALANLMASAYDRSLDHGLGAERLLRRSELVELLHGRRQPIAQRLWGRMAPAQQWLRAMLSHYAEELTQLSLTNPRPAVRATIGRAWLLAFDAEQSTSPAATGRVSDRAHRRKTGLLFVIMGLPAWLRVAEPSRYWRHMRWLYQCGDLFGSIDDAVDLASDLRAGRPNRFGTGDWPPAKTIKIAERIAGRASVLVDCWRRECTEATARSLLLEDILGVSMAAWLGGPNAEH